MEVGTLGGAGAEESGPSAQDPALGADGQGQNEKREPSPPVLNAVLEFSLPPSSYATVFLQEVMRAR